MRAARLYGVRDLRYELVNDPTPEPQEALVAVRAVGVCRTDVELYLQELLAYRTGQARLPIIPGHEWSGEVVEVGAQVERLRPGDRVVGEVAIGCGQCRACRAGWYNVCPARREVGIINHPGAFAELISLPERMLHLIGNLPFDQAALIEPITVALWAVQQAHVSPGDRVAVLGTGPIGQLMLQAARCYGASKVMIAGRSQPKLDLALYLGADAAISVRHDYLTASVQALTDGEGFEVVLEATGNPAAVADALVLAGVRGRIVLAGVFSDRRHPLDLDQIIARELEIKGVVGGPYVWHEAIELASGGRIRTQSLISRSLPLSEAKTALELVLTGDPQLVKVVLIPGMEAAAT